MDSRIWAAIIAGVVSLLNILITCPILWMKIGFERRKLKSEINQLEVLAKKTDAEVEAIQGKFAPELAKLVAETEKLIAETDKVRMYLRRPVEKQKTLIRRLLGLFLRNAFDADMLSERAVVMLKAIRDTRIKLQNKNQGIRQIIDPSIRGHFVKIRKLLQLAERQVEQRCDIIWNAVPPNDLVAAEQQHQHLRAQLGQKYYDDAVVPMMDIRKRIDYQQKQIEREVEQL